MKEELVEMMIGIEDDEAMKELKMVEAEKKEREKQCIYKLPPYITNLNKDAYKPQAISFGLYHHDDPDLASMEAPKLKVVARFLNRSGKSMDEFVQMVMAIGDLVKEWMDAYDSLAPEWKENPARFVELMVRDGCFILEILRYCHGTGQTAYRYAENDLIFSEHGSLNMIPVIRRDMMKLENQLPISVLAFLLSAQDPQLQGNQEVMAIRVLIVRFFAFDRFIIWDINDFVKKNENELIKCKHVLDVHRKMLILGNPDSDGSSSRSEAGGVSGPSATSHRDRLGYNMAPSAYQLHRAGVRIEDNLTGSIKQISYKTGHIRGSLRIPSLMVDDGTESDFRNLMAFERFHAGITNDVTQYICLMDDLLSGDSRSVGFLIDRGIVLNYLNGSDEEAIVKMFNSLTRDVTVSYDEKLCRELNTVYTDRGNPWKIIIWNTTQWIMVAKYGGLILFCITVLQTVFTVGEYYKGK